MYKYIERGREGIINSKWNGKELEREKINREDREDKIEEIKIFLCRLGMSVSSIYSYLKFVSLLKHP